MRRTELNALLAEIDLGDLGIGNRIRRGVAKRLKQTKPNSRDRARMRVVLKHWSPTQPMSDRELREWTKQVCKGLNVPISCVLGPGTLLYEMDD